MALFPKNFDEVLKGEKTREQKLEERREEFIQRWVSAGGTREQAVLLLNSFSFQDHEHPLPFELARL